MLNDGINIPVYVAIISAATALVIGALNVFVERRKRSAESIHMITESALSLVEASNERIERLELRITSQDGVIRELRNRITSVEHDARVSRRALVVLEEQHEALQQKMREWSKGIEVLVAQIERHDSNPEWMPDKGD